MNTSGKLFTLSALLLLFAMLCGCSITYVSDPNDPALTTTGIAATVVTETDEDGKVVTVATTEKSGDGTAHETKKDGTAVTSLFEVTSNNKTPSSGVNTDRFTTEKGSSSGGDKETISSDKYVIKGRMETEDSLIPYTVAHSGDNYAIVAQLNGVTIITINTKSNMYLLSPDKKIYCNAEKFKAYLDENLATIDETTDRKQVSTGTETVDGVTLKYVKYDDNSIDYYYGDSLVKQVSYNEDGEKMTLYVDDVSGDVADSNFKIPSNYTLVAQEDFLSLALGSSVTTAATE